jgi:hypothetical protein
VLLKETGIMGNNGTVKLPLCWLCKHLYDIEAWKCKAFPRVIPEDIQLCRHNHCIPYKGDNGIKFELIESTSQNKRRSYRISEELKAQYLLKGEGDWKECIITDLSREGMGITFQTSEIIDIGTTIQLKIFASALSEPVNAIGVLKWIERREDHIIGGIRWYKISRG